MAPRERLRIAHSFVKPALGAARVAVWICVAFKSWAHERGQAVVYDAITKGGGADKAWLAVTDPKMPELSRSVCAAQERST